MRKLCSVLAVLILLPLAALGNVAPATTPTIVPTSGDEVVVGQTAGYQCCWVFLMGRWHCIPC